MLTKLCTAGILSKSSGNGTPVWGISSAGRALAWHARGHRFDPGILHQTKHAAENILQRAFCLYARAFSCHFTGPGSAVLFRALLLYWISLICSTFLCKKWDRIWPDPNIYYRTFYFYPNIWQRANLVDESILQKRMRRVKHSTHFLEVRTRFELVNEGFADLCLTTWPPNHG